MRGIGLLFESEDGRSRFLVYQGLPPVVVGRKPFDPASDVRVPTAMVSRRHVCISAHPTGYTVEDAGSSGGAYLDGERLVGPTPIGDGARLQLSGDTIYRARTFQGESLADLLAGRLQPGPVVDVREGMCLARDALTALRPLHLAGEVHGSLDLHQFLRDEHGRWTLLSRGWTALDPDGAFDGDPLYVAPEVFHQHRLEAPADLYAFGLVLYEAMVGRRPYADTSPEDNRNDKLFGGAPNWPPRDECRFELALQDFFHALLQYAPEARPDLAGALERVYELRPDVRLR